MTDKNVQNFGKDIDDAIKAGFPPVRYTLSRKFLRVSAVR